MSDSVLTALPVSGCSCWELYVDRLLKDPKGLEGAHRRLGQAVVQALPAHARKAAVGADQHLGAVRGLAASLAAAEAHRQAIARLLIAAAGSGTGSCFRQDAQPSDMHDASALNYQAFRKRDNHGPG